MLYLGDHPHWLVPVAAIVHPGKMYSRPAHDILGTGLPVQHPNNQQYLKAFDGWCLYTVKKSCQARGGSTALMLKNF